MKKYLVLVLVLPLLSLSLASFAQAGRLSGTNESSAQGQSEKAEANPGVRRKLEALLSPVGVSVKESSSPPIETYRQAVIRWDAYPGNADHVLPGEKSLGHTFTVTNRQIGKGTLPQQRSIELSSGQMLVVAVNKDGQMIAWDLFPDPRILRQEAQTGTNELKGQVLHRSKPEFLVAFPDDKEISELRFYHPQWTGSEYVLDLLGTVPF